MSFLSSFARVARTLRPAANRRFSSTLATQASRKSYRSLVWGGGFGVAAYLALSSNQVIWHISSMNMFSETLSVDPATSIAFPTTMRIPSNLKLHPLSLIGIGVRTVSFLGVKVYSIGFYADLSNPNLKIPLDLSPEEKIDHIIRNTACVIRIVPTRNTSYTHLRDAFMRAMNARLSTGYKEGTVSEDTAMMVASPLRTLKGLFPNSPLNKHVPLDIFLAAPIPNKQRPLVFRDLGSIESDWLATEFVLNYFDKAGPSPPLKASVFDKIKSFSK
ncbi:hypothetical protein BDN70DRAFT_323463 [Pholiota conissans]|uniref:Chalcone isomerase domain-containing protein n=1 Tax=Pholiota conissans TaxID=109636 RepID=A0A9P5YRR2_9AGAR|nr:hypothetical protein BDN70DRAFT_323463 [Pholiota conissans]